MTTDRRTLITALPAAVFLPGIAHAAPEAPAWQKEVLAFYYGWYRTPYWSDVSAHWPPDAPIQDTPAGGPYDSLDPAVIKRHVREAKAAGLTTLVASWWGQADRTNSQLPLLLDACKAQGLKVCAYVEQAQSPASVASDALYLHKTYGSHPAWLRLKDKPVIMFFDRLIQNLEIKGWQEARQQIEAKAPGVMAFVGTGNSVQEIAARAPFFDALHIYSQQFAVTGHDTGDTGWTELLYANWVNVQRGLAITTATVLPGYDDHSQPDRTGQRPIVARDDGRTYGDLWLAAIKADPDWVFVVSFNEWHEGTEIEPSQEYGDSYLRATALYSRTFLGS